MSSAYHCWEKVELSRGTFDIDAEEEPEGAEILDREFTAEMGDDGIQQSRTGAGKHNVIHV